MAAAVGSNRDPEQKVVDTYFHPRASYWKELYQLDGVHPTILQLRRDLVLAFVDSLKLRPDSPVLEIGCGAGLTTVALAQRGCVVTAVDTVDAMTHLTRQLAAEKGVEQRVQVQPADAQSLPFPDSTFKLVLAIGVLPWMSSPTPALREMVRVLAPGGYLVVTAQNRSYFTHAALTLGASVFRRLGLLRPRSQPPLTYCSPRQFDALLPPVGLEKLKTRTVGFPIVSHLPKRVWRVVHNRLQALTERDVPWIRLRGTNYVVLARKSVLPPSTA